MSSGEGYAPGTPAAYDAIARERIKYHSQIIKEHGERVERMDDEISNVRRELASIVPFVSTIRKLLFIGVIGVMGTLGAQLLSLILARRP